ncbi:MAG: CBS domain-containing protein [Betaproteobacteria bacterium]|nr:CBS domain-containing protein [Gammaproteobacteria bacterium]MDH3437271.1 CBS domain-containing protein [Betaproteobacteria bacterium]
MSQKQIVRVRDVMNDRYILVDGLETVGAAFAELKHKEARCIIVKKRNERDEYGVVLLSDIARKVIAPDRPPDRVNIYEIMSKPVISVRADMDIRYTVRLFSQFGIAVAPVIEQGEIIGVVTYTDIVLHSLSANE